MHRDEDQFWWERTKAPWFGALFDQMILRPGDPAMLRIARLREECLQRYMNTQRYRISMKMAKIVTDCYEQTEGEHPALRRAKAIYDVFTKIPIPLSKHQLIAGTFSSGIGVVEFPPEMMVCYDLLNKDMSEILNSVGGEGHFIFEEEDKKIFKEEIFPYWRDKSFGVHMIKELRRNYPETWHYCMNSDVFTPLLGGTVYHTVPSYLSIIETGLIGVKEEIKKHIAELDPTHPTSGEDYERRNNYEAMIIAADGLIAYANRCADLAEDLSKGEGNVERADELAQIARICRKVPAHPAETWWEALQSLHFLHMGTILAEGGNSHSMGNFDQYMYPFLKKDLENGTVTLKEAQTLLECFFFKCAESRGGGYGEGSWGQGNNDRITIGGQDSEGRDRSNLLSRMCLEAHAHAHLNDPNISVRVHRNTTDEFLIMTLELIRLGGGLPYIISDEAIIPGLLAIGVPLQVARNYCDLGCQEVVTDPNICQDVDTYGQTNTGWFNIAKPIELALWNGVNPVNGKQVGPATGDPREFNTFGEFMKAVKIQFEYAVKQNVIMANVWDYTQLRGIYPHVYHNLMFPGPRKTGIDITAGGCRYNWAGSIGSGAANAGDILTAIDYLIYEKKEVTFDQMLTALKNNWIGFEDVRKRCINAPKYGTNNAYADQHVRGILEIYFNAFESFNTPRKRGRFTCGLFTMGVHIVHGRTTGATPDGREAGEHLADACSPSQYAQSLGPAETHMSAARAIDTIHTVNGVIFNQKFSLQSLLSEREIRKWADLVKTYIDMGGQQVAYTIVDQKTLLDAQIHPERYRDLWVRVGGYSALFIELSKELQDQIIARSLFSP